MNKYLRNILTISATTLMVLGFGGVVNQTHIHASCITALDKTKSSHKTAFRYIKKAENNHYVKDNAVNDASNFLDDNNKRTKLFNHYYLNPCKEKQYKVAVIGNLAYYIAHDPDEYAFSEISRLI